MGKRKCKRGKFHVIIGGKKDAPKDEPSEKASALSEIIRLGVNPNDPPPARFLAAINSFVIEYLVSDRQRPDPIDQISTSGVLLRLSAGIAAPVIGGDADQFVSAARTMYLAELEAQKKAGA